MKRLAVSTMLCAAGPPSRSSCTSVHVTVLAMLFVVLNLAPCFCGAWVIGCSPKESGPITEGQEGNQAVMIEDEDDPAVWEDVRAFERAQTPETTKQVLRFLDEKLTSWGSHPAGLITSILEVVGEHRIDAARSYVVRFLYADEALDGSDFIRSTASRVLGMLGGAGAFEELQKLARLGPSENLSSIATGLGVLHDPRSIPLLEEFAVRPDADLRARALSSLSKYCSPTSRDEVMQAIKDRNDRVRNSAMFWLSACAVADDDHVLSDRVGDASPLVRMNALRGLVRLGSRSACKRIDDLMRDPDLSVREVATEYGRVCSAR